VGFDEFHQGANEILRFSATRGDKNVIATMDIAENQILRGELCRVLYLPNLKKIIHRLEPLR
jgi:hypothetical protein